jgi:hypothetical protein
MCSLRRVTRYRPLSLAFKPSRAPYPKPVCIRSTIRYDSPLSSPTPQQKNHPQFKILSYSSYVFPFPPQKIIHHLTQIFPTPLLLTSPSPHHSITHHPPHPRTRRIKKRRQLSKPKASLTCSGRKTQASPIRQKCTHSHRVLQKRPSIDALDEEEEKGYEVFRVGGSTVTGGRGVGETRADVHRTSRRVKEKRIKRRP